jgi:hypothetical protein
MECRSRARRGELVNYAASRRDEKTLEFEIFLATVHERWEERVPLIFDRMVGIF